MTNTFNRNDGTFAQVDYASVSGTPSTSVPTLSFVTNVTTADIALSSSTSNFTTGPVVTQGSSGTWLASGGVTITNTAGSVQVYVKLWDGTTVIASGADRINAANTAIQIGLSGIITSPSSNLKIAATSNGASSVMSFNFSGQSMDCNVAAVRIA